MHFSYFFLLFTRTSHHLLKGGGELKPFIVSCVPSSPFEADIDYIARSLSLDITNAVTLLRTVSFFPSIEARSLFGRLFLNFF